MDIPGYGISQEQMLDAVRKTGVDQPGWMPICGACRRHPGGLIKRNLNIAEAIGLPAMRMRRAGILAPVIPREFQIPFQAAGSAIASLLITCSMGWPSSSRLIGSSCFLPDSVRGISGTARISFGRKRRDSPASMTLLIFGLHCAVERNPFAQHHEQRHVAFAAEILEVDLVFLAMKPLEWAFLAALLLLDPGSPEERIDRMYR